MNKQIIIFVTGTRADFGKLKSLIEITRADDSLEVHLFVTGMHMNLKYGKTVNEIIKCGYDNIFEFINHQYVDKMDLVLAKTIEGFSNYVTELQPDLIVVHGDRVEALAGATVGAINNILVSHIEGGEVSGTVDEFFRHSISKMSHLHFVANQIAAKRLIQMGEDEGSIFVIGSPDIDIMNSDSLPSITAVIESYEIQFKNYAIVLFHPVTTELNVLNKNAKNFVDALIKSKKNYVVLYPNNDHGSEIILSHYETFKANERFVVMPSMRFEYFLVLLKNADFIIGNSSAGIREAPYYGVPTINIGTRQNDRGINEKIRHVGDDIEGILAGIESVEGMKCECCTHFGSGESNRLFYNVIKEESFWQRNRQKKFRDQKIDSEMTKRGN